MAGDLRHGFRLLGDDECEAMQPPPYIVKGLLGERQVGAIVGAPGAGKSLLAPYLAHHVARGAECFGRKTKPGPVLYIAAEDDTGMAMRRRALRMHHGDAPDLHLVVGVHDLLSKEQHKKDGQLGRLLALVKEMKPCLVIIDTLAAAFPALEENDSAGMGTVAKAARLLARRGPCVLLVAHDAKAGGGLVRGHSSINGDLDVSLALAKADDGTVTARATKNRNGPLEAAIAFRVGVAAVAEDEDGDPYKAAYCEPVDPERAGEATGVLTGQALKAWKLFQQMVPGTGRVDLEAFKAAAREQHVVSDHDDPTTRRTNVNRAIGILRDRGLLEIQGGGLVEASPYNRILTEVDGADDSE